LRIFLNLNKITVENSKNRQGPIRKHTMVIGGEIYFRGATHMFWGAKIY